MKVDGAAAEPDTVRPAALGTRAIRQIPHSPGEAERICGCMGQTYDAPSTVTSAGRPWAATTAVTVAPAAARSSRRRAILIAFGALGAPGGLEDCAGCVATARRPVD